MKLDIIRQPDRVRAELEGETVSLHPESGLWQAQGTALRVAQKEDTLSLTLLVSAQPVRRIFLRWSRPVAPGRVLGDHWERGYGDLEWRDFVPERVLPWFFLHHDGAETCGAGVRTRPNALCWWQVDPQGVTLALDTRCGGMGVEVRSPLELCTVCELAPDTSESAFTASRRLMRLLCTASRLPKAPVYGGNNWYYAYGVSSTEDILADAARIARWSEGLPNRPFMVIDDGWQIQHGGGYNGGPWDASNADYPDMRALADGIRALNVRPGIWLRPLLTRKPVPDAWKLRRPIPPEQLHGGCVLDPTVPEVLGEVADMFRGLEAWGYELIKQDFSSFDLLGRWGMQYGATLTDDGWAFADRTKTTAMAIKDLYDAMRRGVSDDTLLMGCNTFPHLSAGVFELSRTGDDTSGRFWERTRFMGVNTLAFRMPQHGIFQSCDADCVGLTRAVEWEKNALWLDVLARSGTPLFVSAAPDAVGPEQERALKAAFALAAQPHAPAEPLDWMTTTCPAVWRTDTGDFTYDWCGDFGAEPLVRG